MATTATRILIVEDDAGIRSLMFRHFRNKGYEVEQAAAAEEAILHFSNNRFDVVLTDVHLPGESGFDLARRFHEARPDQTVVFMTGDSDTTIASDALAGGAAGYLLKPFEFFELDAVVNHALQRRNALAAAVVRPVGEPAHVTLPTKVVLRAHRARPSRLRGQLRAALAIGATLAGAFLVGVVLA